jgi:AcrR family transcriptional regulator
MSRTYDSPTRKAQAEQTRLSILRALVDLLVEEHPATISVPRVAEKAGVSVRIVYHYFPTKDALFDGLLESFRDLVIDQPDPTPPTTPRALAEKLPDAFRYFERNAALFRALQLSEWGARLTARRQVERARRLDSALASLRASMEEDDWRIVRALVGALTTFAGYETITSSFGLTTEEAARASAWATRVLTERAAASGVDS